MIFNKKVLYICILFSNLLFDQLKAVTVIGQPMQVIQQVQIINPQNNSGGAELIGAFIGTVIGVSVCELIKNRSHKKKKNNYAAVLMDAGYTKETALAIAWAPTQELQTELLQKAQQQRFQDTIWEIESDYPDAEQVLSVVNINILNTRYPNMAARINTITDLHTQHVTAYRIIKDLGIYSTQKTYSNEFTNASDNKPNQYFTMFYNLGLGTLLALLCMIFFKILLRL